MQYLGINYEQKHIPTLDPNYIPFGVWMQAYLKDAKKPLAIAVERTGGHVDDVLRGAGHHGAHQIAPPPAVEEEAEGAVLEVVPAGHAAEHLRNVLRGLVVVLRGRVGIGGIHSQFFKIEIGKNICDRKRAAGMTAGCGINRVNNADANAARDLSKLIQSLLVHELPPKNNYTDSYIFYSFSTQKSMIFRTYA